MGNLGRKVVSKPLHTLQGARQHEELSPKEGYRE